jgi:tRNA dimethylallyltransferase
VGGGTVYLGAVLHGLFEGPGRDDALRERLQPVPTERLHQRLAMIDPPAAAAIQPGDRLRIVRALEVHAQTGRRISELQAEARPLPFSWFGVGLERERSEHREAIASRAQRMVADGLLDEIRRLLREGLSPEHQAFRTIGVPEAAACLRGDLTEDAMEREIIRHTWALARRQRAWFRREKALRWIDVTGREPDELAREIVTRWRRWRETR